MKITEGGNFAGLNREAPPPYEAFYYDFKALSGLESSIVFEMLFPLWSLCSAKLIFSRRLISQERKEQVRLQAVAPA